MYPRLAVVLGALLSSAVLAQDLSALELGPEATRARRGSLLYVAPASGGVVVIDVSDETSPKVVGRFADGRVVSRILVQSDSLVLLETFEQATTWSLADPRTPVRARPNLTPMAPDLPPEVPHSPGPATEPPVVAGQEPSARAVSGRVIEVRGGRVIFDAPFSPGAHVRVIAQRLERKPDLATGEYVDRPSGEQTAVVRIEEAQGARSMAQLGRGDIAEPGDLAEVTEAALTERLLMPRRAPFNFLAGFHVRPFLGLDANSAGGQSSKPVGFLLDAYATWYPETLPLAVSLQAQPVGFALGASEAHYPGAFSLVAAYATDFFEIGLGAGALAGNRGPCFSPGLGEPLSGDCEVNTGLTFNQTLRLGALDGVNVSWRSSIFSRPDRFVFGVGRGEANLPITRQLGLFAAGGGGENGWGFGEFGVRTYVGGIGARGTVLLSASLGYSGIFDGPSHEQVNGPSVAFGAEWRL